MQPKKAAKDRKPRKLSDRAPVFPSVDALAAYLGIGRHAAYEGLRDGTIPSIRVGKRFVIPRAAIDTWLQRAGSNSPGELKQAS